MKTRYKILIIFGVIFVILFSAFVILKIVYYETWGDNEEWYHHPLGYKVECEFKLFGNPGPCIAVNDNGEIMVTKTEINSWKEVDVGITKPLGYHVHKIDCKTNFIEYLDEDGNIEYLDEDGNIVHTSILLDSLYSCKTLDDVKNEN